MSCPVIWGGGTDSRANGSFPQGAGRLSEKSTARHPPPHQPSPAGSASATPPQGGSDLGARASRPHPVPLAAAELQCDAAGSHPVGGNGIGRAEGEPWRRCRSIQVEEMAKAARPCAGGTPALPGSHQASGRIQRPHKRDARAPRKLSSHDIVTPRAPNCRSILVPLVVEGGPCVFLSIRVPSCPFVVHLHE